MIANYDHKTFIVQAIGRVLCCIHGATWGQGYVTFYRGNLLPFHGNTVILCFKSILPQQLPWKGSTLQCFFMTQRVSIISTATSNTMVIYHGILTLEKDVMW
jgi:hypothetical protein